MSGHTPGPWFVVNRGTKHEPMTSVMAERIRGRGPSHEVAVCATGDSSQEMEDANARLIAAAPEMLAALRDLLDAPDLNLDELEPLTREYIAEAQAAIAKAEGRS